MKIDYNIPPFHQTEADVRLEDAMLYAALKEALGDRLEPFNSLNPHDGKAVLWGPDPFNTNMGEQMRRQDAYADAHVLAALGAGVPIPAARVQVEMVRLSHLGLGSALRNMKDPTNRKRFMEPGSKFYSSSDGQSQVGVVRPEDPVLVYPHYDVEYERRFLVVAGRIAGESPFFFCDEKPMMLLDPANRTKQARKSWGELENGNPEWIALQRAAVEELLADFPMPSGAIDVALVNEDGKMRAQITEVTAARPGNVSILFADPVRYADMIAAHLLEIEPRLEEEVAPPMGHF